MLSSLKTAVSDLASRVGTVAQSTAAAVGDAVGGFATAVVESKPVVVVSDGVTVVASTVSGVVVDGATAVSDAAVGAARSVRDFATSTATGAADAVTSTVESGRQAIADTAEGYRDTVEDGLWAVQRPVMKTGSVAAGMASHLAPVLLEKALSRLMPSVFLGPLAPIGKVIAIIELVGDARKAASRLGELLAEADRDLDAATRRRLEERRFKAEERLAEMLTAPSGAGNGEIAVLVAPPTVPNEMAASDVDMDARLLTGPFADRRLSSMTGAEIGEAIEASGLPETRRLLEAWLRARVHVPRDGTLGTPEPSV